MNEAEAVATLRELIANDRKDQIMQAHVRKLGLYAPSAFMRMVMAVPPAEKAPQRFADWAEIDIDPDMLDQPVTLDEVSAWLDRTGSAVLVPTFASFVHRVGPDKPFGFDAFVELVAEKQPDQLAQVVLSQISHGSPQYRRLVAKHADLLADAAIRSEHVSLVSWLGDALPAPALGRVLAEKAKRGKDVSFSDLRTYRRVYDEIPEVYTELVCAAAKKTTKSNVSMIGLPRDLRAESIEVVLDAVKGKQEHFQRIAAQAMAYSPAEAPKAIAPFLGNAKRGALAARLLAVGGPAGRRAAIDARDALGKKKSKTAERVRDLVSKIEKLPEGKPWLMAIANQPSGWSADPAQWTLHESPKREYDTPPHEPTSAETLRRALEDEVHDAEDLQPHQWADLLQVTTIYGWKNDLEWAVGRAKALGWLGWGDDPAQLWRAIEHYDYNQHVSLRHSSGDKAMGLFHLLIGAEASLSILLHAFARSAEGHGNLTLGQSQRNFTNALRQWDVDERVELELIAQHLDMIRHHRISSDEIDRYPTLEDAKSPGSSWTSTANHLDFRLRATATGAKKLALHIRDGIELGVDLTSNRWWQKGLGGADGGQTAILGSVDRVQVDVESVGSKMRFTVAGMAVASGPQGHLYTGLPLSAGTIRVETDGALEHVRLTEMLPMGEASDMASLLVFEDEAAIRDLQDTAGTPAAHALAVETLLGENEAVVNAARAALSALGAAAEPYLRALGVEKTTAAPTRFEVRSFDACVEAFAATQPKKKLKVTDDVKYGFSKAAAFGNPTEPKWSSGIAEDTLYLSDDATLLNDAKELLQASIPAVCVWNKKGDARWAGEVGEHLIATASFWPDEYDDYGEYAEVLVAAWKVKEGIAVAAWKGDTAQLATIIGAPWPSKRSWQSAGEVWLGE